MSRLFYHVMQDNVGNLLFDVSGTMRIAGTGTLATIYGDEALTAVLPNPMTNHPSFASFKCFLGAGDYDFYMAKSGYTFETLTGVQGHGTMAQQDAANVEITGGSVTSLTNLSSDHIGAGTSSVGTHALSVNGAAQMFGGDLTHSGAITAAFLHATTGGNVVLTNIGVGGPIVGGQVVTLRYVKGTNFGLVITPSGSDAGGSSPVVFNNVAGTPVGSISTTASATAYNTSSDARLKTDVAPLTGALDVVRALNPVSFLWKADGTPGRGLLAQEVQDVIPDGVITGERDAVDAEGNVLPQMIDYSKLVPWLIGAVQELTQQVEMLTAQMAEADV